jgi:hypothetical protein
MYTTRSALGRLVPLFALGSGVTVIFRVDGGLVVNHASCSMSKFKWSCPRGCSCPKDLLGSASSVQLGHPVLTHSYTT